MIRRGDIRQNRRMPTCTIALVAILSGTLTLTSEVSALRPEAPAHTAAAAGLESSLRPEGSAPDLQGQPLITRREMLAMALGLALGRSLNTPGGDEALTLEGPVFLPPDRAVVIGDLLAVALPQPHKSIGQPVRAYAWIVGERLVGGEGYALQQRLYVPADGIMTFQASPEGPGWHLAEPILVLSRRDDNFTAPWETLADGLIVLHTDPARITTPDTLVFKINADGTFTHLQNTLQPPTPAGLEEVETERISLQGIAQSA